MKRTSKISLILLTSTTFLAGCTPYSDKDCQKDKQGNCIQTGSQSSSHRGGYGYPIFLPIHHGSYVNNSTGHNTHAVNSTSSHSSNISRGGFGTTAHFSASS